MPDEVRRGANRADLGLRVPLEAFIVRCVRWSEESQHSASIYTGPGKPIDVSITPGPGSGARYLHALSRGAFMAYSGLGVTLNAATHGTTIPQRVPHPGHATSRLWEAN